MKYTIHFSSAGVAVSMILKRVFDKSLAAPDTIEGTLKLAAAISAGTVDVKYAQKMKCLPDEPFGV